MTQGQTPHVEGELSLREIQLASLEILKRIDEVCQREDIHYWLMYGSLIGAVRHHGFIPWDDDLDIAMPRQDYERFLAYFADHLDELRPLVALHGNEQHKLPFLITRVSDTRYKMIGEYGDEVPDLGTFVDVYPIDGCGNDKSEALALQKHCVKNVLRFLQAENFSTNNQNNGSIKKLFKKMHALMLGSPGSYIENLSSAVRSHSYESSLYLGCLVWPWDDLIFCHDSVRSLRQVKFEDTEVPIPSGYEQILTGQYGDYMSLPPEDERVGHHSYSIVKRSE